MNHVHKKLRARLEVAAIIAAVLIGVALALPANAAGCATYEIGRVGETSHITGRNDVAGIQVSLEGHYLWVNLGAPADALTPEQDVEASFDVAPDVIGATVCPDGSVSFVTSGVVDVPDVANNDEPAPVVVSPAQPAELVDPLPVLYPATAFRLAALVS